MTDTSSAIFILAFICAWPKQNPLKSENYEPLMTWKDIEKQFPWRLILLLGGSLAMAEGCEVKTFNLILYFRFVNRLFLYL